jgi:1,4-alpha-glucan branching enzyme
MLGDIDLHLIGEGTHRRLWQVLGVHVASSTTEGWAAVWAPNARAVSVVGDWNGWNAEAGCLTPVGSSGVWWALQIGVADGHHYKFQIEDATGHVALKADPVALRAEHPPSTASIVVGPSRHVWDDDTWMTRRSVTPAHVAAMRIYELHAGSWRVGLGWRELAEPLAEYVANLGFTHIELLPVAEHPFGPSWGYQVTGYFAPTARCGSPDDFRYFVDHLHQRGIGVIVDWVPAHFPKDDWALAKFDGTALYEHADPRRGEHPDWGTLIFNYGRIEVRNFLIANALYWLEEFHVDGLRVDAVASMLYLDYSRPADNWLPNEYGGRENLEAVSFLQEFNRVVHAEHAGVVTIAEESTSWPKVTAPIDAGGLGFTHKWNMGWMHDTLEYFHHEPVHRRFHHRDLTFGLLYAFSEHFVLPLSHDEVVHGKGSMLNKMSGDEWQQFANLRALYAWMWAYPGSKLLFMGSELAQRKEWSIDDGVDWAALDSPQHRGVHDLIKRLNAVVDQYPSVADAGEQGSFTWLDADDAAHSVFAFVRRSANGEPLVCVANFTPVVREGYRLGVPLEGSWRVVVNTDDGDYAGSNYGTPSPFRTEPTQWQNQPASFLMNLPPLATIWLVPMPPEAVAVVAVSHAAVSVPAKAARNR